jgi:hypothetical protein
MPQLLARKPVTDACRDEAKLKAQPCNARATDEKRVMQRDASISAHALTHFGFAVPLKASFKWRLCGLHTRIQPHHLCLCVSNSDVTGPDG